MRIRILQWACTVLLAAGLSGCFGLGTSDPAIRSIDSAIHQWAGAFVQKSAGALERVVWETVEYSGEGVNDTFTASEYAAFEAGRWGGKEYQVSQVIVQEHTGLTEDSVSVTGSYFAEYRQGGASYEMTAAIHFDLIKPGAQWLIRRIEFTDVSTRPI